MILQLSITLSKLVVMKLSFFQEEMMVKKDQIKIEEELEKQAD